MENHSIPLQNRFQMLAELDTERDKNIVINSDIDEVDMTNTFKKP